MIEQALRQFCESRHRTLIVIAGTFIVGLVLIVPLVDLLCSGSDEKESLLAELESARNVAAELKTFESRVSERTAQLKLFEDRTVDEESLPALRNTLVDMAKETGCSIRKLSVGGASSRDWQPGESPFSLASAKKSDDGNGGSGFSLEWRPVSISLSGTSSNLRSMIEKVAASKMLMHTKSLEMYPSSPTRETLTLDMEVWYYALAIKSKS